MDRLRFGHILEHVPEPVDYSRVLDRFTYNMVHVATRLLFIDLEKILHDAVTVSNIIHGSSLFKGWDSHTNTFCNKGCFFNVRIIQDVIAQAQQLQKNQA